MTRKKPAVISTPTDHDLSQSLPVIKNSPQDSPIQPFSGLSNPESKNHTHCVPAGHGYAFHVKANTRFRIVDLHGEQVVDMMAWVGRPPFCNISHGPSCGRLHEQICMRSGPRVATSARSVPTQLPSCDHPEYDRVADQILVSRNMDQIQRLANSMPIPHPQLNPLLPWLKNQQQLKTWEHLWMYLKTHPLPNLHLLHMRNLQRDQFSRFQSKFPRELPLQLPLEKLSMAYTRHKLSGATPTIGESLYTNAARPLLTLTADTVKTHDMTFMACNPALYADLGAAPEHRSCAQNIFEAMRPFGMRDALDARATDPFNVFQNTPAYTLKPLGCSKPGDFVEWRAEADCVVAVSCCPFDLDGFNGGKATDIAIVTGIE